MGIATKTYKDALMAHQRAYANQHKDKVRFIGYNTAKGSRMYGTLSEYDERMCIETPICENLMVGMAVGMALEGYRPIVCFERHDFLLIGLDALVNHLDKLPNISYGQFKLPVVVRAIVGARGPLNPGVQHFQDYTAALQCMLRNTQVFKPDSDWDFKRAYSAVGNTSSGAVVIVEKRDWYDKDIATLE